MASAAVHSKTVIQLLFIHCLLLLPLYIELCLKFVTLRPFQHCNHLAAEERERERERERESWLLYFACLLDGIWLFTTVRWVGLQCRIVVFFWSYCNFGNFRENFIFVNCIKRHIVTKPQLTFIRKRQIILAISRGGGGGGGIFKKLRKCGRFRENKTLAKISGFTVLTYFITCRGTQWLSGRVLDSRPRGRGFEPHRRHCVVVLEQDILILA